MACDAFLETRSRGESVCRYNPHTASTSEEKREADRFFNKTAATKVDELLLPPLLIDDSSEKPKLKTAPPKPDEKQEAALLIDRLSNATPTERARLNSDQLKQLGGMEQHFASGNLNALTADVRRLNQGDRKNAHQVLETFSGELSMLGIKNSVTGNEKDGFGLELMRYMCTGGLSDATKLSLLKNGKSTTEDFHFEDVPSLTIEAMTNNEADRKKYVEEYERYQPNGFSDSTPKEALDHLRKGNAGTPCENYQA